MAMTKHGQEALITREQYKALKRMDRPEVEAFIRSIYQSAYAEGLEAAPKREDFANELIALLASAHGVGQATISKVKAGLDSLGQDA